MTHESVDRSMAGLRVGVDLTSVAEVEDSVSRFGDRYVKRIFTRHEIESCTQGDEMASSGLGGFSLLE